MGWCVSRWGGSRAEILGIKRLLEQTAIEKSRSIASSDGEACVPKSTLEHSFPQSTSSPMRRPPFIPVGIVHIRWKVTTFHDPSLYLCSAHGPILSEEFSDFAEEILIVKRHTRMVIFVCHVLLLFDIRPLMKRKSVAFHKGQVLSGHLGWLCAMRLSNQLPS